MENIRDNTVLFILVSSMTIEKLGGESRIYLYAES